MSIALPGVTLPAGVLSNPVRVESLALFFAQPRRADRAGASTPA